MRNHYYALTAAFLFVILFACRKDMLTPSSRNPLSVVEARAWFNATSGSGGKYRNGIRAEHNEIPLNPVWDKAIIESDSTYEVVELPVTEEAAAGFQPNHASEGYIIPGEAPLNGITRLIIVKNKETGELSKAIMRITAATRAGAGTLQNNTYSVKSPDFSGYVVFSTQDNRFINGWQFKEGKVVARMEQLKTYFDQHAPQQVEGTKKGAAGTLAGPPRPLPREEEVQYGSLCSVDVIDWYTRACYNGDCTAWEYVGSTLSGITCTDIPGSGTGTGGTGGGLGSGPLAQPLPREDVNAGTIWDITTTDTSITNNPKAKCLLSKLYKEDTQLDSLVKAFKGKGFNLNFKLASLPVENGKTEPPFGQTTNVNTNFTITLDRSFVRDHSQIEIAKTFLHEAFHANLSQRAYQVFGSTDVASWTKRPQDMTVAELMDKIDSKIQGNHQLEVAEHEYMAQNINAIAKGLKEVVENYGTVEGGITVTDDHYLALAHDGLTLTAYYNGIVQDKTVNYYGSTYTLHNYYNNLRDQLISGITISCQ